MDNTYALRQIKKNAAQEENLAEYNREYAKDDNRKYIEDELDDYLPQPTPKKYNTVSDQNAAPSRRALENKGDDLYDKLQEHVAKFKSDLETKSYLNEGGKKKKKSSRKHGRTRSKRPSITRRRRRVSRKRNRHSRRK